MWTCGDRPETVRDELEAELVRRFGKGWRALPQPSRVANGEAYREGLDWNEVRDSFDTVVQGAGLEQVPLAQLVAGVASLLAPAGASSAPVADAALELAQGMVAARRTVPRAALDAVLAVVVSGHPALAEAGSGPDVVAAAAALWDVATRIAGAVLARQLAAGGARLSATFGPGVLGAMPVTIDAADLDGGLQVGAAPGYGWFPNAADGELAERYRIAAARCIHWQQHRVCLCQATHRAGANRHHLHRWRPGTPDTSGIHARARIGFGSCTMMASPRRRPRGVPAAGPDRATQDRRLRLESLAHEHRPHLADAVRAVQHEPLKPEPHSGDVQPSAHRHRRRGTDPRRPRRTLAPRPPRSRYPTRRDRPRHERPAGMTASGHC